MKTILFDVDGTLYNFGQDFNKSSLKKKVKKNAVRLLNNKLDLTLEQAKDKIIEIEKECGEDYSLAFEKLGISREEYFNSTWNLNVALNKDPILREILLALKNKYFLYIVSDAPFIWVNNVLKKLDVKDCFDSIYTGESDLRKNNGKIFEEILKSKNVSDVICVGDKESSDVNKPKSYGIKSIKIGKKSEKADFSIKTIYNLPIALQSLENKFRKVQIGVMGSAFDLGYSKKVQTIAQELGKEIAVNNCTLVFGAEKDGDSLSTIAARNACFYGGKTLGVTYGKSDDVFWQPDYLIKTGMDRGGGREFILVNSCDVIICIGGGSGTLTELGISYQSNIPMVVINGTGGWSDKLADSFMDERKRLKVIGVATPKEAVKMALEVSKVNKQKKYTEDTK